MSVGALLFTPDHTSEAAWRRVALQWTHAAAWLGTPQSGADAAGELRYDLLRDGSESFLTLLIYLS